MHDVSVAEWLKPTQKSTLSTRALSHMACGGFQAVKQFQTLN